MHRVTRSRPVPAKCAREPQFPRMAHLPCLNGIALQYGTDEDNGIAAPLHYAAEDACGRERLEDIRRRFGEAVAKY